MTAAPVLPDRRLRLGMVGGGLGGVIGRSHRVAALLDGRRDLVAGALSADSDRAAASAAVASTRFPAGHPEGFIEDFANIYRDTGDIVLARETSAPAPDCAPLVPSVVDGARGIHFREAVLRSGREGGGWADARITID